jgi:hypothetical protein
LHPTGTIDVALMLTQDIGFLKDTPPDGSVGSQGYLN